MTNDDDGQTTRERPKFNKLKLSFKNDSSPHFLSPKAVALKALIKYETVSEGFNFPKRYKWIKKAFMWLCIEKSGAIKVALIHR